MACNRQPGTAPLCAMVEDATGWKITQNEWHELRQMAKENGHVTSRERADKDRIEDSIQRLSRGLATGLMDDGLTRDEAANKVVIAGVDARLALLDAPSVTRGTLGVVNLLAEKDIADLRKQVGERLKAKKPVATKATKVDPKAEAERQERFTALRRRDLIAVRAEGEQIVDSTRRLMDYHLDGEDRDYMRGVLAQLTPAVNDVHLEYGQSETAEQTRANLRGVYEQLRGTANAVAVNYNEGYPAYAALGDYFSEVSAVIRQMDERGDGLRQDAQAE